MNKKENIPNTYIIVVIKDLAVAAVDLDISGNEHDYWIIIW